MKIHFLRFFIVLLATTLVVACHPHFSVQKTETQQYVFGGSAQADNMTVDNFIKPYRDSLRVKVNHVLAHSDVELTKGLSGKMQTPSEMALGNFMTDACLEIAIRQAEKLGRPKPDISIFTWGSLRKSLPKGDITLNNVYELMPFENEMMILKMNGKQIKVLLNQLADSFEPIAGATIVIGNPNTILVHEKPIDEAATYYVLASDYLSFGGNNLSILTEASERYLCNIKIRDAVIQYLENLKASGQTIKPNYEQRIR